MQLSIPRSELAQYYKLPIVDCGISKIVIHVKVPVTQANREWKLVELLTTPFGWENDTCMIMHDILYLAVSQKSMRPISGAGLHQCRPYHDRMCFLPRFSSDAVYGPQCAFKMYEGATVEEITKHCSFRCYRSTQTIISEVKPDTYVLTHPKPGTRVRCPGVEHPVDKLHIGQPGALQVQLPCTCSLYENNTKLIPARVPCGEDSRHLQVIHVLPATWSTLRSFRINPLLPDAHPVYNNLSECLNTNWTKRVPHLNLSAISGTSAELSQLFDNLDLQTHDLADAYSQHRDLLVYVWNIIITGIVLKLWFNHRNAALAVVHAAVPTVSACEGQGSANTVGIWLFSLYLPTVLLLIAALVFFLIVYLRRKYKRRQEQRNRGVRGVKTTDECAGVLIEGFEEGILTLPSGKNVGVRLEQETAQGRSQGPTSSL